MRKALIAAALAATAMALPAQAFSINFQNGGNTLVNPGEVLVNQFTGNGPGRAALTGGTNSNAFTYFVGTNGEAAAPAGMDNNGTTNGFGAVLGNGTYTYALANAVQVFSFLLGTLDSYNSVTLNFQNGTSQTFQGDAIIGETGLGSASGRVTYDVGGAPGITSVVFASEQNSFEFDDFAVAAPEPATWAMMIFGFGVAGVALRRRRRPAGKLAIA